MALRCNLRTNRGMQARRVVASPAVDHGQEDAPMNIMTPGAATASADIGDIAESTSAACISTRVRQLSRIVTRVYDDALRPMGITASQFTLLTQLAQQDGITAVEIGHALDIEKSTLSRNLKRLLALRSEEHTSELQS